MLLRRQNSHLVFSRNGPFYYRAQYVKLSADDYLWKRSPEDFCTSKFLRQKFKATFNRFHLKETTSFANYTTRFVGVQYSVDMSIIQYATSVAQSLTSNVRLVQYSFLSQ